MNPERLGPPDEFARELAAHLALFADPGLPLPSADDLRELFELTFFASLHEEEARRTGFNVAWQPSGRDCSAVLAFGSPVRATPKNLAKLAPATQQEATSIAVRRDESGLVAWALLERNAAATPPLTIRALATGVLRIDYAGVPRALYARGEILLLGGAHEVDSPARRLTSVFSDWRAGADPATGIDPRAAVVTRIAARALEHGHGGMILLVPAAASMPRGVRVHYPVTGAGDLLAKRYANVLRDVATEDRLARLSGSRARGIDGRMYVRDELQISFAEGVELVARLTAIDNSVLFDTALRLRGFGVQVLEADAPQTQFRHSDPYSDESHFDDLSTFKGTRHPAGVLFCLRQEGEAAAIIASQDSRLSLATKDELGAVEVLGSYEHGFGWR